MLQEVRIKLMDRMAQKAQALWRGYRLRKSVMAMNEVRACARCTTVALFIDRVDDSLCVCGLVCRAFD